MPHLKRSATTGHLLFGAGKHLATACPEDGPCEWPESTPGTVCSVLPLSCFGGVTPDTLWLTLFNVWDIGYVCPDCFSNCNGGALCFANAGGMAVLEGMTFPLTQTGPCQWMYTTLASPVQINKYPDMPPPRNCDGVPTLWDRMRITLNLNSSAFPFIRFFRVEVGGDGTTWHTILYQESRTTMTGVSGYSTQCGSQCYLFFKALDAFFNCLTGTAYGELRGAEGDPPP